MAKKKSVEKSTMPAAGTQKEKALERAVQEIEKQFGKGAIMMLGSDNRVSVPSISTGSASLDIPRFSARNPPARPRSATT